MTDDRTTINPDPLKGAAVTLENRILDVLAKPEWQEEPPGSGLIAEVLHESRRDVQAALRVLVAYGKVKPAGGNNHTGTTGFALVDAA